MERIQRISTISEVQEAIKSILCRNVFFAEHGVEIACENAKDIDYMIQSAIGKTGILAVIATPALEFGGFYSEEEKWPYWAMNNVSIVVTETPVLNRGRANYATALDTALQIAQTIAEINGFKVNSIVQSEEAGFINVVVSLNTNIIFKYCKIAVGSEETSE